MVLRACVIGGGLGGIMAAVRLCHAGYQVDVFEKNASIGGRLARRAENGFRFDLGPGVFFIPDELEALFQNSGKKMSDYFKICSSEPAWRNIFEDGTAIDMYGSADLFEKHNPDYSGGFRRFMDYSRAQHEFAKTAYLDKGYINIAEAAKEYGWLNLLTKLDLFHSMAGGVAKRIRNAKTAEVMSNVSFFVCASPQRIAGLYNHLACQRVRQCGFYVEGGPYAMIEGLAVFMKELGIKAHTGCEVVGLRKRSGRIREIVLADESIVAADLFVSAMDTVPFLRLVSKETADVVKKYDRFGPAASAVVLNLGVTRRYPQLAYHNFYYSKDTKHFYKTVFDEKEICSDPTLYVCAPSVKEPACAPKECENIKVVAPVPYIADYNPAAPEDYQQLREAVIEKLERMGLKSLRRHILAEFMQTPISFKKEYNLNRGAVNDTLAGRWQNQKLFAPKKVSLYSNLTFT